MAAILYFAYGSNLDVSQMRERCPNSRPIGRARLQAHRLDFTHLSRRWGGGAADIVPEPGDSVWGALYRLDRSDLDLLDHYEGGYERTEIRVEPENGNLSRALTYTVRMKGSLEPTEEYLQKLLRWGGHWGFPQAYLSRLREIRSPE